MLRVPPGDDLLRALVGVELPSSVYGNVSYRLGRALGAGSMAVAFLVERRSPTGTGVAVIKMARPEFVRAAAETALLTIRKESVALGRLNERVPPTPFVVRFIESGETELYDGAQRLVLPWLAMEYVHGETLETRIEKCIQETRFSFDPERAAFCVEAIALGLDAVHSVDVIHRDIKPNNVLCCGVAPEEAFKISDFGVARPVGLKQTFMQGSMGTPGFASPEQIMMEEANIGPASDVFSLASTAFTVLTGEELFPGGDNIMRLLERTRGRQRRSIRECVALCDEIRSQPTVCHAIDAAIALGTAPDSRDRPQSAGLFGAMITNALRTDTLRADPASRRSLVDRVAVRSSATWNWKVRHAPGSDRALRSVAWDAAGTCLAATTSGLSYWNGTDWAEVRIENDIAAGIRAVHHVSPGHWLVAGDHGFFGYYITLEGMSRLRRPRVSARFDAVSGQPEDIAVAIATYEDQPPLLLSMSGKRWLRELAVTDAASLMGIARFDEERWIVVGRRRGGGAFSALYAPLRWEVYPLHAPAVRTLTACAAVAEVGVGVVVGAEGSTLRINSGAMEESIVPGKPDLSAVVVEPNQRAWTTSLGAVWVQTPQEPTRWTCAWEDTNWHVPIISLFSDGRRVLGVAADGAVIEGCEY